VAAAETGAQLEEAMAQTEMIAPKSSVEKAEEAEAVTAVEQEAKEAQVEHPAEVEAAVEVEPLLAETVKTAATARLECGLGNNIHHYEGS